MVSPGKALTIGRLPDDPAGHARRGVVFIGMHHDGAVDDVGKTEPGDNHFLCSRAVGIGHQVGKVAQMAAENLIAGLKGERLPHCVNPEVYERRRG